MAQQVSTDTVRELASAEQIARRWKTGNPIADKSRPALLNEVTLYTSLESCAQCSGVMSLAGVKRIVYLQNDFTAYQIGNIMYNLANRTGTNRQFPGAPIPVAGSEIGLPQFQVLNEANLKFAEKMKEAEQEKDEKRMFFRLNG